MNKKKQRMVLAALLSFSMYATAKTFDEAKQEFEDRLADLMQELDSSVSKELEAGLENPDSDIYLSVQRAVQESLTIERIGDAINGFKDEQTKQKFFQETEPGSFYIKGYGVDKKGNFLVYPAQKAHLCGEYYPNDQYVIWSKRYEAEQLISTALSAFINQNMITVKTEKLEPNQMRQSVCEIVDVE